MFQTDWYDGYKQLASVPLDDIRHFDINKIEKVQYSFWAEHCLECAPPECYKSCEYYVKRVDGRCKRTEHGQELVSIDGTVMGSGAIIKFRPWAKIETYVYDRYYSIEEYRKVCDHQRETSARIGKLGVINPKGMLNSACYFFTTRTKDRTQDIPKNTDSFLFEIYSPMETCYKMMIEAADLSWKVIARTSVDIKPGFNSYLLDYRTIAPKETNVIRFYPENSLEAEVVVVNAEFVELKKDAKSVSPAKKVKCVAWDLDNTIWNGILSETDDVSSLKVRDGVKDLIVALDQRGVIQTVVSKNDYEPAWNMLKQFGLDDYFLYPAINWGQKSSNLVEIAKELNINIDTFAMIDDSDFERREISTNLPQVRVYPETIISELLSLPEFDIPVTEEAKHRREMYQTEYKRKTIQASYAGNYLDFIKSCEMVLEIGNVEQCSDDSVFNRCYELVSRTNQLNISGHKYSKEEFTNHLNKENKQHIYVKCGDKYGSYGIVGYVSFDLTDSSIIIDELAVSCRVAQKHVEYTILSWIARQHPDKSEIIIKFIQTGKNTPMFNCLTDIGFNYTESQMTLSSEEIYKDDGVIKISVIN